MEAKGGGMRTKEPVVAESSIADPAHRSGTVEHVQEASRPLLMVDIDGVISLFAKPGGSWADRRAAEGSFHSIEGIPHFLSSIAAAHLLALGAHFDLVWASGWEEKAEEYLPHLLDLPSGLPFLRFARSVGRSNAHWKLEAIEAFADGRPLAWIDDAFNEACHEWARARSAPTLLVQTEPEHGLTTREAQQLLEWARACRRADREEIDPQRIGARCAMGNGAGAEGAQPGPPPQARKGGRQREAALRVGHEFRQSALADQLPRPETWRICILTGAAATGVPSRRVNVPLSVGTC